VGQRFGARCRFHRVMPQARDAGGAVHVLIGGRELLRCIVALRWQAVIDSDWLPEKVSETQRSRKAKTLNLGLALLSLFLWWLAFSLALPAF